MIDVIQMLRSIVYSNMYVVYDNFDDILLDSDAIN